ncbi:MAG TPA: hypothetical protein VLN58_05210 [Verrucomicrobiae bacterium]|nr:hypothetical protein [Verrucomicrobiae bacterium]
MESQSSRLFGGGSAGTLFHPLVAVALLLAIGLILFLPRKHVIVPLLLAIFLIPRDQVLVIGGAHFTALKVLFLTGLIRWAITRGSLTLVGGLNSIDRVFALWAFCYPVVFTLQWMQSQALIKSIGDSIDTFCGYFVLRFLIQDAEDVRRVIRVFVVISTVMALCMLNEHFTQQNVFGLLGGVRRVSEVRDGSIRASGVFQHSILAGCFGATLLPLFLSLWPNQRSKFEVSVGVISSATIIATSNGSTPILAYVAGIFALCLWPLRKQMRFWRWALALAVVGLHLAMNGPVWSLIEKIDVTGSSSSYHRYMLVDNCIRHFGDWWLLGVKNYDTWGFDMWDLSNQYVAYAVTGGLATLACFIGIICRSFAAVGRARRRVEGDRKREWFCWCLGAALFAHVVGYFGIGYFDQMQFAWFALLAIICGTKFDVTSEVKRLARDYGRRSNRVRSYAWQRRGSQSCVG